MEFSIKAGSPEKAQTGCIVVGVFESRKLTAAGSALDRATKGYLAGILKRGDMEGKAGTTLVLHGVPHIKAERVMLLGLGPAENFGDRQYHDAVALAIRSLNATGATDALICPPDTSAPKRDIGWRIAHATIAARAAGYRFDRMKSRPEKSPPALRRLAFGIDDRTAPRHACPAAKKS